MYSNPIKLHRGVDNRIQFRFLNQEQKPVNLTGKTLTFRVIDDLGLDILIERTLTQYLPLTGLALLELSAADLLEFTAQRCHYSIDVDDGTHLYPVFVDQDARGRGVVHIVDSIIPPFIQATTITVPSHPTPSDFAPVTFYSSNFETKGDPSLTFQISIASFTGNVAIEGSTTGASNWYEIDVLPDVTLTTIELATTVSGFHPFVRVRFYSTAGDVTRILVR